MQVKQRHFLIGIYSVILLLFEPLNVFAQSNDEQETVNNTSIDQSIANETDAASQQPNSKIQGADQVFKPSEEISEDLSVPFPTDI